MKARFLLLLLMSGIVSGAICQNTINLTFTAVDSEAYVQPDSIKVMNRTQGGDTILYYPDTVLTIYYVGVPELSPWNNGFKVFRNYPNPATDHTTISLFVPEKDEVSLLMADMLGRAVMQTERVLESGTHSFRFTPGGGNLYFFTARWRENSSSIKILQAGSNTGAKNSLDYLGREDALPQFKAMQDIQSFSFAPGDSLLCIGFANGLESGMPDTPQGSKEYTFQFATNIPCPGIPTVEYEGQVYNTIQIFSQCWLKENLNVGTMIPGTQEMSNNSIIEKYCYNNNINNCTTYGGLYQWDEMMQYTTTQGVQGICPLGWHIPTDEEWKVLEGAVDSQYGIGDTEWDIGWESRGFDAGLNLRSTSGWSFNGNGTDLFGFSGLPGGYRSLSGYFLYSIGDNGYWWTSTENLSSNVWFRDLSYDSPEVNRGYYGYKASGFSVRCLRDN